MCPGSFGNGQFDVGFAVDYRAFTPFEFAPRFELGL